MMNVPDLILIIGLLLTITPFIVACIIGNIYQIKHGRYNALKMKLSLKDMKILKVCLLVFICGVIILIVGVLIR